MKKFVELNTEKTLKEEILESVSKIIDRKIFILGEELEKFEKEFANYCGSKYAIGVGSGTDALRLSLRALGIGTGDKVLTVSFTSPFTVHARNV